MTRAATWTLGVLAGGRSARMGRDKAALRPAGRTLVEHVARRLAPPGTPVRVATRPGGPCDGGPLPCSHDRRPGEGPLVALAALLSDASTPWVLAVTCDQPLLPPDVGERLLLRAAGVRGVVTRAAGRPEPFPALLSAELAPLLERLCAAGERRALSWTDRARARVEPWEGLYPFLPAEDALLNVNTPADLARLQGMLRRPGASL